MEDFQYEDIKFQIPAGLSENIAFLFDIISPDTWNNHLTDDHREMLMCYLPEFPEHDLEEKTRTLELFFMDENFRFGTPLRQFYDHLVLGHFNPEISEMRKLHRRIQYRSYQVRQKKYFQETLEEVLVRRKLLLDAASCLPPDELPKLPLLPPLHKKHDPEMSSSVEYRTRKRYFKELAIAKAEAGCSSDLSEDENYPEGPPPPFTKKQKRILSNLESNLPVDMLLIRSTTSYGSMALDFESRIMPNSSPLEISDEVFKALLNEHKRKQKQRDKSIYLNTHGITFQDILARSQMQLKKPIQKSQSPLMLPALESGPLMSPQSSDRGKKRSKGDSGNTCSPLSVHYSPFVVKKEKVELSDSNVSSDLPSSSESSMDSEEDEPPPPPSIVTKRSPLSLHRPRAKKELEKKSSATNVVAVKEEIMEEIKEEPLDEEVESDFLLESCRREGVTVKTEAVEDTLDLMSEGSSLLGPELTQETHICFFSLLRDIICSTTYQRMNRETLESSVRVWQESAISPLNEWFSVVPCWITSLPSGVNFLCGRCEDVQPADFVPYIEYKPSLKVYQWIGAGRDSDSHLEPLCNHWLTNRLSVSSLWLDEDKSEASGEVACGVKTESPDYIPSPRVRTTWTVRPASEEEKRLYHIQEKLRYEIPHKAFTFRMHGYDSVVGPVKGIYTQQSTCNSNKARGHSLLVPDRPPYVTILSLVRDAVARLPNGEGTRADICELLKESQYLAPLTSPAAEATLTNVVSGALDRLHYDKDPCVKFDALNKIWIYLHRSRNEEEFERMHHLNGPCGTSGGKVKKSTTRRPRSRAKEATVVKGPPNVAMEPTVPAIKQEDGSKIQVKAEDVLGSAVKAKLEAAYKGRLAALGSPLSPSLSTLASAVSSGNVLQSTSAGITKLPAGIKLSVGNRASTTTLVGGVKGQVIQEVTLPTAVLQKALSTGSIQDSQSFTIRHPVSKSHSIGGITLTPEIPESTPASATSRSRSGITVSTTVVPSSTSVSSSVPLKQTDSHSASIASVTSAVTEAGDKTPSTTTTVVSEGKAPSHVAPQIGTIKVLQSGSGAIGGKTTLGGTSIVVSSTNALQSLVAQRMVVSGSKVLVQGGKVVQAIAGTGSGGILTGSLSGKQVIASVLPAQQVVSLDELLASSGSKISGNIIQLASSSNVASVSSGQRVALVSSQATPVALGTQGQRVLVAGSNQSLQSLAGGGAQIQQGTQQPLVSISGGTPSTSQTTTLTATSARLIPVGSQQKAILQGIVAGGTLRLVQPVAATTVSGSTGTASSANLGNTAGNLITIGGKQVILTTKPLTGTSQPAQIQQVVLASGRGDVASGAKPGTAVMVTGGQQIVLPTTAIPGSQLNLKGIQTLHTLKVIPASQVSQQQRGKPMLARIVSPASLRAAQQPTPTVVRPPAPQNQTQPSQP